MHLAGGPDPDELLESMVIRGECSYRVSKRNIPLNLHKHTSLLYVVLLT